MAPKAKARGAAQAFSRQIAKLSEPAEPTHPRYGSSRHPANPRRRKIPGAEAIARRFANRRVLV